MALWIRQCCELWIHSSGTAASAWPGPSSCTSFLSQAWKNGKSQESKPKERIKQTLCSVILNTDARPPLTQGVRIPGRWILGISILIDTPVIMCPKDWEALGRDLLPGKKSAKYCAVNPSPPGCDPTVPTVCESSSASSAQYGSKAWRKELLLLNYEKSHASPPDFVDSSAQFSVYSEDARSTPCEAKMLIFWDLKEFFKKPIY